MWGRNRETADAAAPAGAPASGLKESVRQARVELAERTAVVVDLRDAELARLELLNEALDPLFADVPPQVDLFDRGVSRGDTPRLWIDAIAHVAMGRDKRLYRFVQDTRYGRKVLAESTEINDIVGAITRYVANRLVERERALSDDGAPMVQDVPTARRQRGRLVRAFIFGLILGCVCLFAALWMVAARH
jgi:hypothetical protein